MKVLPRVSVDSIEKYLPHRPPMVWMDEVLEFSEKSGTCRLQIKADGHYMDSTGHLRPTSCLEFIAQAYGFISVCHHIYVLDPESKPLTKAFLVSMKNAEMPSCDLLEQVQVGDEVRVLISGVRQMGSIVLFKGQVQCRDLVICRSDMKIFKEYSQ